MMRATGLSAGMGVRMAALGAVTGLGLMITAAAPAWAGEGCEPKDHAVTIQAQLVEPPVQYVFDESEAQIAQRAHFVSTGQRHVRGVTDTRFRSSFEFQWLRWRAHRGWCMMPVSVVAKVGFEHIIVRVDRKYPNNSCQRRAVLIHEAKHVAIHQEELRAGVPRIEGDLRRAYLGAGFPRYFNDLAGGERYLFNYFSRYVTEGFHRIEAEMARRNTALDNPWEYAGISALCPTW